MNPVSTASTGNSTSLAEAPSTNMNADGTAPASGISSQDGVPSASTGSTLRQKVFVLVYDAKNFEHPELARNIQIPDHYYPFDIKTVDIKDEPQGVLGLYRSKTRAKIIGRKWVHDQLNRTGDNPWLHVPLEVENEYDPWGIPAMPGTWRRSGWLGNSYYVMDKGRTVKDCEELALGVNIEERILDEVDDGEKYETDEEEDGEEDAGDDTQDEDEDDMDSDGDENEDEDAEEGRASAGIVGTQASAA